MNPDRFNRLADVDHGVETALEALLFVAQQGMASAAVRGQDAGAFVGFLQGVVENRNAFKDQIMTQAIMTLPGEKETPQ